MRLRQHRNFLHKQRAGRQFMYLSSCSRSSFLWGWERDLRTIKLSCLVLFTMSFQWHFKSGWWQRLMWSGAHYKIKQDFFIIMTAASILFAVFDFKAIFCLCWLFFLYWCMATIPRHVWTKQVCKCFYRLLPYGRSSPGAQWVAPLFGEQGRHIWGCHF